MRIGFVTTEFVTEYPDGGGLGNYLHRMAIALRDRGHQPEIFVVSEHSASRIEFEGIVVHRVSRANRHISMRAAYKLTKGAWFHRLHPAIRILSGALGLGLSLRDRERETTFDLIQSADYLASGFFVKRNRQRPHIVRCSCASDLYAEVDQKVGERYWEVKLERAALRRADAVYAPSRFVADHYQRLLGLEIGVLRPPAVTPVAPGALPCSLPDRFFIHFGQLTTRKGTGWLSEALPIAWAQEPELKVVFVGSADPVDREKWEARWGDFRENVTWLGRLLKPSLNAVLKRAEAAILPSLVDNLPNTVIESLMFDVPVIGTDGASIDELIEPGVNGHLVPIGDLDALANAMVRYWREQSGLRKCDSWNSPILHEMQPDAAVSGLLSYTERVQRKPS